MREEIAMSDYIVSINTDKPVLKYTTLGGGLFMDEETGNCFRFDGSGKGFYVHAEEIKKVWNVGDTIPLVDLGLEWNESSSCYGDFEFA
mgnify:CR=1 FL=1|tara:strand:- start:84 stop:350 length:267 start_codon:yes stop_codon:yes gene_type:complete